LDFFVLFSSAGSLLGQHGQAGYAAANAFLDALAHYRQAEHRTALTINWGAWAGLGFAASPGGLRLMQHAQRLGIGSIQPERALAILGGLLQRDDAQIAVVPVDWIQLREFLSTANTRPLLSDVTREASDPTPLQNTFIRDRAVIRDQVLATVPDEQSRMLLAYLRELVGKRLGLSASRVDAHQPLNTLGLDSLMAVELKHRIEVDLRVVVPVVTLLQGPTVAELVSEVLNLLSGEEEPAPAPPVESHAPPLAADQPGGFRLEAQDSSPLDRETAIRLSDQVHELSDDAVDALLQKLLDGSNAGAARGR
jgi:acyl carrier protein